MKIKFVNFNNHKLFSVIWLCLMGCPLSWADEPLLIGGESSLIQAIESDTVTMDLSDGLASGLMGQAWTIQVYGSASLGNNAGDIYTAHLGLGYYINDRISINLEALVGQIDIEVGREGTSSLVGMDLLLRCHIAQGDHWTVYWEGGAGFQQSQDPFPESRSHQGTHFNFRPQLGVGVMLDIGNKTQLMAGARWLHISNANKDGRATNPGYDGLLIYSGLMFQF